MAKGYYPLNLANLKADTSDIIYDFTFILSNLLAEYEEYLDEDDVEHLKNKLSQCNKQKPQKLLCSNRVYITSDIKFVSFMMVDVEKPVLDHLYETLEYHCPDDPTFQMTPDIMFPCIWVFEGKSLTKQVYIEPQLAMEIVGVFSKENIVNYGAFRRKWITKPRQAYKKLNL